MDNSTKIGVVTGTGAALNVSIGFIPDYVVILNATDGNRRTEWIEGMTDGSAMSDSGGTLATVAAPNGIAAYAGSATAARGFTIGAGTSQAGKQLFYFAARTSSGT